MKLITKVSILVALMTMLSGCGLAAKTALQTARGGYAELSYIEPVQTLKAYDSLNTISISSAAGSAITPENLQRLNNKIRGTLSAKGLNTSIYGALQISGVIVHTEDNTLRKQVIMRVRLEAVQTGKGIGIVNVSGLVGGLRDFNEVLDAVVAGIFQILDEHEFSAVKKAS